jgi:uncharacterized protein YndB with AHSA1/START domain
VTEVVTSIDIDAPPERVWALAMDPNCLSEWVTIHRRLHSHDDGPPRKGYAMEQTLHLRGVNFKVHWELVACDKDRHAEWHGRGPARSHAETEYRLTPTDDGGTRFDYRNVFTAPLGPLGRVASRALVGGLPRREADASLRKLKKLAESD